MAPTRLGWLTGLLVAGFVLQSLAWSAGRLHALADRGLDGSRAAPIVETTGSAGQPSSAETRLSAAVATTRRVTAAPVHHAAEHSVSIRATLAVMSLGMAYMFVAMQLGMTQMGGAMPGM